MTVDSNRPSHFAAILEAIPVPAALAHDRDARDVTINAAFAELLGVTPAEFVSFTADAGRTMPFAYEFEGRPLRLEEAPLPRAARGEIVRAMRLDIVRTGLPKRTIVGWASPVGGPGSDALGAICVFQDVSAQAEAERNHRELAELTPALLFTTDASGNLASANSRWHAATGTGSHDLLGKEWREIVHPDDLGRTLSAWTRSLAQGAPFDADVRVRNAQGIYRWTQLRAECARDETGNIARWFGSGFDTEAQHRAIDALRTVAAIDAFVATDADLETILHGVASVVFETLADICFFDIRRPGEASERFTRIAPGVEPEVGRLVASLAPPVRAFRANHPFTAAVARGETVRVERATDAWRADAAASHDIAETWRRVGYHSVVAVPLRSSGRALGTLTALRTRDARSFDDIDAKALEEIGRRVAFAVEKIAFAQTARNEIARREEEFRTLADVMPQLMWVADASGNVLWRNRRWAEYTGLAPGASRYLERIAHPAEIGAVRARWEASLTTGDAFEIEHRIRRADGTYRWFLSRATGSRDESGAIARWYGSDTDVDDQRRAALTLQLFANLGEVLSESLGLEPTLEAALEVVVPDFADWGFVSLLDDAGELRVRATYHPDPEENARLRGVIGVRYVRPGATEGTGFVLRTREPYLYRSASLDAAARVVEADVLDILRAVGFRSVLVVPLLLGAEVRGTFNVVMNRSGREFGEHDVPFFREISRRLTPAVANAEVYERERRVARSFQEAALPAELPNRPGFAFHAIYEAGRAEALIGGDWYDAFPLVDGRIVVSIGDVAGSGLSAAVTMANVRQAIRGVAQVHADPALMLEAADRTLRAETPDRFVTAFVGVFDGVARTFAYASAGHPPPLVRAAGGDIVELARGGPPLGLRENVRGGGHVYSVPSDAFFVFYTDGLTESTHDLDEGERRLRAALADPALDASLDPACAIYEAVLVEGSRDDVAILTVYVGCGATVARWTFGALDVEAAHAAERELRDRLASMRLAGERLTAAELIVAELIGNTVRYAPGDVEVLLENVDGRPVVHVLDRGPGFAFSAKLPPDIYSESGRGLFLISSFAEDFNVVRREGGGSHARVALAR